MSHSAPMQRPSEPSGDGGELDHLLGEFKEWLGEKRRERYSRFRPQSPEPEQRMDSGDEEECDECRDGTCSNPEHQKGDDLDALLD